MRIADRVAVITGGARGIGGATAALFAREGAKVVVGDRLTSEGEATVEAIRAGGGEAIFVQTDVTKEVDCAALTAAAVETYGRLDVLVCAAGVLWGSYVPVEEMEEGTFEGVMDVNVTGSFLCAKHAVSEMKRVGGGVIVLIASVAGTRGGSSSVAYGASKGAVHGLAMTLEPKLAPLGIRVNDVCPGSLNTMLKRNAVAEEARVTGITVEEALARQDLGDPMGVARVIAFLASPDADYVRGSVFTR